MVEYLPLPDDTVYQVRIAIKLILDDVIEDLKEEENKVVIGWG